MECGTDGNGASRVKWWTKLFGGRKRWVAPDWYYNDRPSDTKTYATVADFLRHSAYGRAILRQFITYSYPSESEQFFEQLAQRSLLPGDDPHGRFIFDYLAHGLVCVYLHNRAYFEPVHSVVIGEQFFFNSQALDESKLVYLTHRVGEEVGSPVPNDVLNRINDLSKFDTAEIDATLTASKLLLTLKQDVYTGFQVQYAELPKSSAFLEAPHTAEVRSIDTNRPRSEVVAYRETMFIAPLASALGLDVYQCTSNYLGSTFSSARQSLNVLADTMTKFSTQYYPFLTRLADALGIRAPDFKLPEMRYIDGLKKAQALKTGVDSGLTLEQAEQRL